MEEGGTSTLIARAIFFASIAFFACLIDSLSAESSVFDAWKACFVHAVRRGAARKGGGLSRVKALSGRIPPDRE